MASANEDVNAPGTSSTVASWVPDFAVGPDGQPTIYPAPLFMRNTFLEVSIDRPSSLEGFLKERQAYSCPGSSVSQPGSSCEGGPGVIPSTKRVPYRPGELLARSAAYGSNAPLTMYQAGAEKVDVVGVPPSTGNEQDAASECSTVDTLQRQRSTLSPAPEIATPAPLERRQDAPDSADSALISLPLTPAPELPSLPSFSAEKKQLPVLMTPEKQPIQLAPETEQLPSIGSAGHRLGQCKPCAFMHTKGCSSGADCQFCHICEPGEKQRRQKEKRAFFGTMRQLQKMAADTWGSFGAAQQ